MTTEIADEIGYALCQPGTLKAVAVRRIGCLPLASALNSPDIGEAKLEDGSRVLITWGRRLTPAEQHWFAHNNDCQPIWCGADDGGCELVLGAVFNCDASDEWIWAGLRLTSQAEPQWRYV